MASVYRAWQLLNRNYDDAGSSVLVVRS